MFHIHFFFFAMVSLCEASRRGRAVTGGPVVMIWWVIECFTGNSVYTGRATPGNDAMSVSKGVDNSFTNTWLSEGDVASLPSTERWVVVSISLRCLTSTKRA